MPGGRELLRLPMPGGTRLFSLAFSPDGRRFAAGDEDGHVWVWDAGTGSVLHQTTWDDKRSGSRSAPTAGYWPE